MTSAPRTTLNWSYHLFVGSSEFETVGVTAYIFKLAELIAASHRSATFIVDQTCDASVIESNLPVYSHDDFLSLDLAGCSGHVLVAFSLTGFRRSCKYSLPTILAVNLSESLADGSFYDSLFCLDLVQCLDSASRPPVHFLCPSASAKLFLVKGCQISAANVSALSLHALFIDNQATPKPQDQRRKPALLLATPSTPTAQVLQALLERQPWFIDWTIHHGHLPTVHVSPTSLREASVYLDFGQPDGSAQRLLLAMAAGCYCIGPPSLDFLVTAARYGSASLVEPGDTLGYINAIHYFDSLARIDQAQLDECIASSFSRLVKTLSIEVQRRHLVAQLTRLERKLF
jgi:hypothetical protein